MLATLLCLPGTSLVALLGLTLGAGCGDQGGQAKSPLHCDQPARDYGSVWEGTVLEANFTFEVRSETPLTVSRVDADCGCTVARLIRLGGGEEAPYEWGTPLRTGEGLRLEATYDTRGKRGPSPRRLTLQVPELGRPVAAQMLADVRPWLVAEPDSLGITRLSEGTGGEVRFEVRQAEGLPFGLTWTGTSVPDGVEVDLAALEGASGDRALTWAATVRLGSELPRGVRTYPILLQSDVANPDAPPGVDGRPRWHGLTFELPVEVRGALSLSPPNLNFGVVRGDELVSRTLRLECHDPDFDLQEPRLELQSVRDEEPFLLGRTVTLRARPVPGLRAYDLEVVLDGLDPGLSGTVLARLVVETGHPGLPRLEAPLLAVASSRGATGVPK